ncbi:hypothetical protein COY52_03225 [Candidatus Desantisbacteria bacterium CG_4_10_14_0_8_um_filter_48_22]|uniref:PIN domain-containing protein n=1 Tax=Candidatus Desantisbacteria bacterium CG_4_10_14_0_8_um_filter_48_22 TaxID=1974543 RepID=A0A2M7SDV9_9BACT|nr:MAG: hypothetical protein AUJ67_06180 [Candidatus Desantisbacteria bacterium CG1_02_49_89]PIV54366.1 MAG: hypothetical protein COS16_10635 [Candidatus Desantisbacteria bacterium CG02_land_8_20_14_3_00_49_13]PIZ17702.1 MAG: hypothetical protein COY52_03225 [Candidatus Desantisbacteria bacterium CG_4_10_14_0_8_um_filter_48_22]
MINYLFDSSVAIEWYAPKSTFRTQSEFYKSCALRAKIAFQKEEGKAILFIPSFCIAEVRNIFGKWYLRHKNIFNSKNPKAHYETCFNKFIAHVHDRKFFYSYDLNRYHNLNTTEVIEVEHTTDTEFDASGLTPGTNNTIIEAEFKKKDSHDSISKHHLTSFDILIIAMGMELKRMKGEEIYLVTNDKRMALISSKKSEFPKPLYWSDLNVPDLPTA